MGVARHGLSALQLLLLGVVAWFIYRALGPELARLTWADFMLWRPAALPLAISFLLLLTVYIAHALLWRRIVRDLHLGNPGIRDTIQVYFMSALGRYVPGKVWMLAGMAILAGRAGLPPVAVTAAAVIGQLAFLATGMLFLAITLPGWRAALGGGAAVSPVAVVFAITLVVAGSVLWLLVATPLGRGVRERVVGLLGHRLGERLRAAFVLADRITAQKAAVWAVSYALTWVLLGLAFASFVSAFDPMASGMPRYLAGTIAASYLVGYVLPVPAGIGAREGVMIILLQRVGIDPAAAVVISVLSRVWFTAAELVPLAALPALPPFVAAGEERR